MGCYHYIGWYIRPEDEQLYTGNVPGRLKMRYVAKKINETNNELFIFSLADRKNAMFYGKRRIQSKDEHLVYSGGCKNSGRFLKKLNSLIKKISFCKYIIFECKPTDTILLYHSVPYTKLMVFLKNFFTRNVICEVEEIYGYSAVEDKPWVDQEIAAIKKMDSFIFVNAGIPEQLGIPEEKYVVSYGACIVPQRKVPQFNDGKIHVVYAGTVESRKLGAFTAIETAKYLSDDYVMHIIGFGSDSAIAELKERIFTINTINGKHALVEYNGYKTGDELDQFLFSCHIGLSSNVMRPNFANNSFPSKVITYMCHDLSVVLGYADAFYSVPEAKKWTFYMSHEPKEIAKAILKAPIAYEDFYEDEIKDMDTKLIDFLQRNGEEK